MSRLHRAGEASHQEVLALVDAHRLWGRALGVVDAHLLASARLTPGTSVWTRDQRLAAVASDLGLT